jgi:Protein of unknown function (DUF3237)
MTDVTVTMSLWQQSGVAKRAMRSMGRNAVELMYRVEANTTKVIPIGAVPEGVRLDVHWSGTVVEGRFAGAGVQGVDYLLWRADGVGIINSYQVITTAVGQNVSVHAQGYITAPAGMRMPTPDVVLRPDFHWPDVPLPAHGFALYRAGAPDLSWLNQTALAFSGSVNVGTGTLVIAMYTLQLAPVGMSR